MAAYVKYELAIEKMMEAGNAGTDSYAVILSNTAPNVATATNAASVSELATSGGYTAGGNAVTVQANSYRPCCVDGYRRRVYFPIRSLVQRDIGSGSIPLGLRL
jgi:hypothetical protein